MEKQSGAIAAASGTSPTKRSVVVVDTALGVTGHAVSYVAATARRSHSLLGPVGRRLLRPPAVPAGLQPATWLSGAARRGAGYRDDAQRELAHVLDVLVPLIVNQLASRLDLTRLVKENVDVTALAEEVIADVDLPGIIRGSTAAVASDTLLGVRMQSISGDEALGRALVRFQQRLGGRRAADTSPGPGAPPET